MQRPKPVTLRPYGRTIVVSVEHTPGVPETRTVQLEHTPGKDETHAANIETTKGE